MNSHVDCDLEFLLQISFRDIGEWIITADKKVDYCLGNDSSDALLRTENVIYAFCCDDKVMYVGKTTQSPRQRFAGYRNPGAGQQTNIRVNDAIQRLLAQGRHIRILVFAESHQLDWGGVPINLPAALEDGLIELCQPPWNRIGTNGYDRAKTESSVFEAVALGLGEPGAIESADKKVVCSFAITLGQTYFNGGYINPGVEASNYIGVDGSPITIYLGNHEERVDSFVNRRANGNGSVRIIGNNRKIAEWFQVHYSQHSVVYANVLGSGNILLLAP